MINPNVTNQPSTPYTLQEGGSNQIALAPPEQGSCHSAPRNDALARSLQEATSLTNNALQALNTRTASIGNVNHGDNHEENYLSKFLRENSVSRTPQQIDQCIKKFKKAIEQETRSFCNNDWKKVVKKYLKPDTTGLNFLEILVLQIFTLEIEEKFNNPLLRDALVQFLKDQGVTLNLKSVHKFIDEGILKANPNTLLKTGFKQNLDPAAKAKAQESKSLTDAVCEKIKDFRGVVYDPSTGKRLCEGTLISPHLFLTTGHYSLQSTEFTAEVKINFNIKDKTTAKFVCGGCNPENDFAIFRLSESSPRPQANDQGRSYVSITDGPIDPDQLRIAVIPPLFDQTSYGYQGEEDVPTDEPLGPGCSGLGVFNLKGELFMIHSYVTHAEERFGPQMCEILDCLYKNNQDIYNELKEHHTLPEIPSFPECYNSEEGPPPSPIDPRKSFEAYKEAYKADPNFYWNYVYEIWTDKELLKGVEDGSIRLNGLDEIQTQQYERARTTNQALLDKENNEKQEFINNLKTQLDLNINNSNYNPLTKSFKLKHFASLNSAKQNAQNRKFQQETATKRSTLIEDKNIKRLDWINEIKTVLEGLRPEHLDKCGKNFRVRTTGRGRFLPETTKPYDLKVNVVTKSKNKNDISNTQVLRNQKFNFSIQINAEGLPQINHFSADGN